ncbi:unnamed protein product, partial [Amoebophrya sp. A25]
AAKELHSLFICAGDTWKQDRCPACRCLAPLDWLGVEDPFERSPPVEATSWNAHDSSSSYQNYGNDENNYRQEGTKANDPKGEDWWSDAWWWTEDDGEKYYGGASRDIEKHARKKRKVVVDSYNNHEEDKAGAVSYADVGDERPLRNHYSY